jgi:heme oxygenase
MAEPEFTDQIRKRTRAAHKLSDVLIVSKLAVVLTDQKQYGKALAYFYPIYCYIERAMVQHRKVPELAPLADLVASELHRKENLEADLEYYLGSDWQAQISCQSAAVDKYLEHLEDLVTKVGTCGMLALLRFCCRVTTHEVMN